MDGDIPQVKICRYKVIICISIFLILNAGDYFMSAFFLEKEYARELNPIISFLSKLYGIRKGILLTKLQIIATIILPLVACIVFFHQRLASCTVFLPKIHLPRWITLARALFGGIILFCCVIGGTLGMYYYGHILAKLLKQIASLAITTLGFFT